MAAIDDELRARLARLEARIVELEGAEQTELEPWEQPLQITKADIPPAPIEGGGFLGTMRCLMIIRSTGAFMRIGDSHQFMRFRSCKI